MKAISLNRNFQVLFGAFVILTLLSCTLTTPMTITGGKTPVENGSGSTQSEDGILEMHPSEVPATPSQPEWQPQLQIVLTQALAAGQAQVVDVAGNMQLNFPAGAFLETPPELVVSQVEGEIPVSLPGFEVLQAYDVALGDLHSLAEPVEVSMSYDPSRLNPDLPAETQLGAALRDGESGRWVTLSATIEESSHTISFSTDHLSLLVIYLRGEIDSICTTFHFYITYNRANITNSNAASMNYNPAGNLCLNPNQPPFILAVADYMEAAYQGYVVANFPFKEGMINVEVADIPSSLFWGQESQFDHLSGELVINIDSWAYPDLLRQDCAHELFHYWQYNQSLVSYLLNHWWMDATADYAADKVAYASSSYGPTNSMADTIRPNYLEGSMTSTADFHAYSSATFVDYLISQVVVYPTLRVLWNETAKTSSVITDIDTSLKAKFGSPFVEVYRDFANYMLFDSNSKLPISSPVWTSNAVNDRATFMDDMPVSSATATVAPYASIIWGLRVENPHFFSLTWTNPNGGAVYVFMSDSGDQRDGTRLYPQLYATKKATFPMKKESTAYIFMVNPTSSELEFKLTYGISEISVYSLGIDFDNADPTCQGNLAWGTPNAYMEIAKDGMVTFHYDSKTDDYYWTSPESEHTMHLEGQGRVVDGTISADLVSSDTIRLGGVDKYNNPMIGSVVVQASVMLAQSPSDPFYWDGTASGNATIQLPATTTSPGYSCMGKVSGVSVYPVFYFPLNR